MVKYCSISKGRRRCVDPEKMKGLYAGEPIDKSVQNIKPNMRVELIKKGLKKPLQQIKNHADAGGVIRDLSDKDREQFRVIHLDTKNRVVGSELIGQGTLNEVSISPRETFKGAILNNSNAIIIGHNHPSGNTEPSEDDIKVCRMLKKNGELLGIPVLDCVIVGKDDVSSHKYD